LDQLPQTQSAEKSAARSRTFALAIMTTLFPAFDGNMRQIHVTGGFSFTF
jgi:hypothetical protein